MYHCCAVRSWNTSRWFFYLALAGCLHGALLLGRGCVRSSSASPLVTIEEPLDVIEFGFVQDPRKEPPGLAPGGGSLAPQSTARVSAPEQRVKPSAPPRLVERAPKQQERVEQGENSERPDDPSAPQPFATDMLASDLADTSDEVRPHAARRKILADNPALGAQSAPDAALQVARNSAMEGTGIGANGGPGGLGLGQGRGSGVIGEPFAFGGPAGAFRADVCFIERTVRLLTDITACEPVATFFTSELNVSPRRFDRGFPGLGPRTEWFAIKYSGKFSVKAEDSYTFRLLSDDGARLEIDGRTVLNNDGQHLPIAVSVNVRLEAGVHDFFLFYYQGPPYFVALQLFVKRFAHDERLFGPVI